jgi:hypothetical protein
VLFNLDDRALFQILKNCALGTLHGSGYVVLLEGKTDNTHSQKYVNITMAQERPRNACFSKKKIKEVHYKFEQTFTFERNVTTLRGAFLGIRGI